MNSLYLSHYIIKSTLQKGDVAIDATCGNGKDTAFLADILGENGFVYSFDIQDVAIEKASRHLLELGLSDRVKFIKDSHEKLDFYVQEKVKAVMFNLGYLPGGDHSICTKGESTICAIKKAMELISDDGIISIVIYYGGDSGFEEKEAVISFVEKINPKDFSVMKLEFVNQTNCPPILVCIRPNL